MTDINTPFPTGAIKRRKKLMMRILLKSVVYAFAIFGILMILLLLAVLGLLRQESGAPAAITENSFIEINFDEQYREVRGDTLLTEISGEGNSLSFFDLVRTIDRAATDPRIKVLVGKISDSELGLAQIEEIRAAVRRFREAGKKAYIFSPGFGLGGNGTSEYYLAAAFDEIWLQPGGEAAVTGLSVEVPFAREGLDKLGIKPEFYARYEYKTAMASLTDKKMPKAFREDLTRLGGSLFEQIISGITEARKLPKDAVISLINEAPLNADIALERGLVDQIGYWPDLMYKINEPEVLAKVELANYAAGINDHAARKKLIAVVNVEGIITDGASIDNPLQGEASVGAETLQKQLDEIAGNKKVKAVVLRVNSPGGSYTASNAIWYALKKLKSDYKLPLIVSMGDYAASGGYFIALAGDKLLAEPSTLTGSIGVLGGKMVLKELWEKIGIEWSGVKFGRNAGILSPNQPFSKEEKANFNKSLDNVYKDFCLKVAEARHFDKAKIDQVARGRVWTGAGALENGLIDEIGGLQEAIKLAQKEAGLKPGDKVGILIYPKQKSLSEKISEMINAAPTVAVQKIYGIIGFDGQWVQQLKQMQYDLAVRPLVVEY